jgi:hypothetical protein
VEGFHLHLGCRFEEIAQSCRGLTRASSGRQHESLCDSVSVAVVARHTALSPSVACACRATVTTTVTAVLIVSLHLLLLPLMLLLSTDGERQGSCCAHSVSWASGVVSAPTRWSIVGRPLRHARTAQAVPRATCLRPSPRVSDYDAQQTQ